MAADPLPRSGGSYLFAALNLSNWNGIAKAALLRVSAHVAFVTEHKLLAAPLRIARRWMTTKGWSVFSSPAARTEAGGVSGGVMITVRREVVAHPVPPQVWESLSFDPVTRSRLTACILRRGILRRDDNGEPRRLLCKINHKDNNRSIQDVEEAYEPGSISAQVEASCPKCFLLLTASERLKVRASDLRGSVA